ncbi:MAG: NAD(P)-dependent oxidoreductase [Oscillibacter sp.]|nr:NAD(P)-dependent oxidoreductase [Oscillibacter sp.]
MSIERTPASFGPIGMVGLGNMGLPMSTHMIAAGFRVIGTARTEKSREALRAVGGESVEGVKEIAEKCHYIILALSSIPVFREITAQLAELCPAGTVIIETGTFPIQEKETAKAAFDKKGVIMMDVPLSGTGEQAKHKDVVCFGSGDKDVYEEILPILKGFSKAQPYLGKFSNGMKMKFIANQLVAIHNVSTAEAVLFAEKLGIDVREMIAAVGPGAGGSRMLDVRGPVMADRSWATSQITNRVFHKDMLMIAEALHESGCPSPLFSATIPIYTAAIAAGHAEDDTASVYAVLAKMCEPDGK